MPRLDVSRAEMVKSKLSDGGGGVMSSSPDTRRVGSSSSFQALRHAVSSLYRFDDFDMETLGSGFFSKVYKVAHKTTNEVMVLKMNVNLNNRPNMLREVQLMNRLSHPNILKFMGVCVHEGQLHALTEFMNGGCLEELLADNSTELPWELRLKLATDTAKGMRFLHSRRIIHRDLTSKNVLIRKDSGDMTAVVGDFGLACKLPDPLSEKDKALPIVGSPYWMAPECINGQIYNEKADVFSYGIILCETIARIEADPDILPRTRHFGLDYMAFTKMIPDMPQEFLGFLHLALNCCQIDPKKRHSFIEIVNILEELKSKSQMAAVLADINSLHLEEQDSINKAKLKQVLGFRKKSIPDNRQPSKEPAKEMSPPRIDLMTDLSPVFDSDNLTPQVVAEFVSKQDEFYTPHNNNPFASRFEDANNKLVGSVRENWTAWFELPSPSRTMTPPATPSTPDDSGFFRGERASLRFRKCHSLPGSPTMNRKEIDRFHEYDTKFRQLFSSFYGSSRRLEDDLMMAAVAAADDSFDAQSEGSSSNDSAVGLEYIRGRDYFRLHRKFSIETAVLNSSVDRYRSRAEILKQDFGDVFPVRRGGRGGGAAHGWRERPRSWLGDDLLCSTSSSESCMSVEDAFVLSPSSSFSSYSDLDSELLHFQHHSTHHRSRERFQELVKAWEAKELSRTSGGAGKESGGDRHASLPSFPRPRGYLSHKEPADYYLERVRKFQELRHKWESQQQQQQKNAASMAAAAAESVSPLSHPLAQSSPAPSNSQT